MAHLLFLPLHHVFRQRNAVYVKTYERAVGHILASEGAGQGF